MISADSSSGSPPGPGGGLARGDQQHRFSEVGAGLGPGAVTRHTRRLGKDEKLAKEASLPFTVRVSSATSRYLLSYLSIYLLFTADPGESADGRV